MVDHNIFSTPSPPCRDHSKCHKNHIEYYEDRGGHHASLMASHFKNASIKGEQDLPIFPALLSPLSLLEKATHACYPHSKLLFHDIHGAPYKEAYFSYVCSKAISLYGVHLTANDMRHMFVTLWKDFINSPTTNLLHLTVHQACASAADLMLNSTAAWGISYDDTNRSRGLHTTHDLWPKFTDFVKQAHLDAMSRNEWDPIHTPLSVLPHS